MKKNEDRPECLDPQWIRRLRAHWVVINRSFTLLSRRIAESVLRSLHANAKDSTDSPLFDELSPARLWSERIAGAI